MKPAKRTAFFVTVIILNLLLLSICGWAFWVILSHPSPSAVPDSQPTESQSQPSARPEASEAASSAGLPESSLPEEPDPAAQGIFSESVPQAQAILDDMTLSEKLGQLLLTRVPDKEVFSAIETYQPAGFVLFAKDFEGLTADQVRQKLAEYQSHSQIPLAFAVDEEGGEIVRVSKFPSLRETPFSSPLELYAQGGLEALTADAAEKSAFLLDLGIQMNLAPVCDVTSDSSAYIYRRTFGVSAEETADCVRAVVSAMEETGISSCLKHFPGYGGNLDTHTGISIDNRDRAVFDTEDFLPFQAGIDAGADAVLVSHNIVTCMDPDLPASLSPEVHRILREDLGFTGLILTDDLAMDAVSEAAGDESPAVLALRVGNDLILATDFAAACRDLEAAWNAGAITAEQVDAAVLRVLSWKLCKGILVP